MAGIPFPMIGIPDKANGIVRLKFCEVELAFDGDGVSYVRFPDGSYVSAVPHDTHHYHVIAHRCGYQDDIRAYCAEHEFCHAFLEQEIYNRPSPILYALAHKQPINEAKAAYEELAVHAFQCYLRANQLPIVSGPNWARLKSAALKLL